MRPRSPGRMGAPQAPAPAPKRSAVVVSAVSRMRSASASFSALGTTATTPGRAATSAAARDA